MKRIIAGFWALLLCFTMTCTAFAADFVPSITYKPAPELVTTAGEDGRRIIGYLKDKDGNILSTEYEECLLITPLSEIDNADQLSDEEKQLLKDKYNEFANGTTTLSDACPALNDAVASALGAGKNANDLVIKDFFDATALCEELKTLLPIDGNTIDLTFDIGVAPGTFVAAMVYVNGQWVMVDNVVNNGDGTITGTFEDICPVAFLVPADTVEDTTNTTPVTGDANGNSVVIWSAVAGVSLLAIIAVAVIYRRKMGAK